VPFPEVSPISIALVSAISDPKLVVVSDLKDFNLSLDYAPLNDESQDLKSQISISFKV